jgi:hypothetical protein
VNDCYFLYYYLKKYRGPMGGNKELNQRANFMLNCLYLLFFLKKDETLPQKKYIFLSFNNGL